MCYNKSMWSDSLIRFWCDNYYALREYELLPFERHYFVNGMPIAGGKSQYSSPYEETCDRNYEFDMALKQLGQNRDLFVRVYIDGGDKTNKSMCVYNQFCKILKGNEKC